MGRGDRELLEAGARAPEFRLPLMGGGEIRLSEVVADGPALLAFFKISCPVCQLAFPFLERVHQAGAIQSGAIQSGAMKVFGISQNDDADTRAFAERFGTTFPMLLDSERDGYVVSNAYGISSVPTIFTVGAGGMIEHVTTGWSKREMTALGAIRASDSVPEWKAG